MFVLKEGAFFEEHDEFLKEDSNKIILLFKILKIV